MIHNDTSEINDRRELAHPGGWLLQSVIAEVARQAKRGALVAMEPRPETRQMRVGRPAHCLQDRC